MENSYSSHRIFRDGQRTRPRSHWTYGCSLHVGKRWGPCRVRQADCLSSACLVALGHHEECFSWCEGLAVVALASTTASPASGLVLEASGGARCRSLCHWPQKKRSRPSPLPQTMTDYAFSNQPSQRVTSPSG